MTRVRTKPVLFLMASVHAACVVLCSAGCSSGTDPEAVPAEVVVSAERDGAQLFVRADHTQLKTTDRVTVVATAAAPSGMVVRSIEFDPVSAGWTLVTQSGPDSELDRTGRAVQTLVQVLEPFLAGDYEIPSLTALFAAPGAPGSISLSTTPISIKVESVLLEDAKIEELAPAGGPVDPPDLAPNPTNPWVVGGIISVFLCLATVALVRVRTRGKGDPLADPVRELALLRAHPATDPLTDRDRLAAILRRAQSTNPSIALSELLCQVDAVRYAPPGRYPADSVDSEIDSALGVLGGGQ